MAPKLYMIPASPPVRSVLMCANALDLELELKHVSLFSNEHLTPEYLELNPQHTVPTLVDDDGFVLWDSHAIMSYLVSKYGKDDALYPKDLKKRAVIDQRLHFDSHVLFNRGSVITRKLFLDGMKEIPDEQKKAAIEGYEFTEKFLEGKEWVAGDNLSIADFSFASSITTFSKLIPGVLSNFPRINGWLKKMEKLPCYAANIPGLKMFEDILKSKLES